MAVPQTLGQRILSRFAQIDTLVTLLTSTGSKMTAPFYLPRARYTVFVNADPVRAARSFAFIDEDGQGVEHDLRDIPEYIANVPVPLVQQALPKGRYRVVIEMEPNTSSWIVQVVLNSMLSWETPPPAWRPSVPLPQPITLGSGRSPDFRIEQTGTYAMDLRHLGQGKEHEASWPSFVFLGAGRWKVEIDTECDWELTIRPMVGPSGGGARWF